MHALGALMISLLFLWLWFVSGLFGKSTPSKREAMVNAIVVVILVGLGWELFEYAYDIATPIGGNYALDTFRDLLADFIGAVVGGFIGRLKVWYE